MREGLRAVLQAHAGHPADGASGSALDAVLGAVPLRAALDPVDGLRLHPAGSEPISVVVAGLLDAIRAAGADGGWERLKVCARGHVPVGVVRHLAQPVRAVVLDGGLREPRHDAARARATAGGGRDVVVLTGRAGHRGTGRRPAVGLRRTVLRRVRPA